MTDLSVFDNIVSYNIRNEIWNYCTNSTYRLGWQDIDVPEKYDLNIFSKWYTEEIESTKFFPYIKKCIDETDWFTKDKLIKVICNLVRPDDVHYTHVHPGQQVCLYYVNLDWRDGWHGETLFYNPNNLTEIVYTSLFVPGRIILFDGSIPHAIRPQSVRAPKFRFSLSLFFD
tara:strand:- start:70 stop:585 length:516 start_codon:yes stop_codon:yes gene_type:complete